MRSALRKRLEAEMERHEQALAEISAERVLDFGKEWRRTRRNPISLRFGMGTMSAEGVGTNSTGIDRYSGAGWPRILEELDKDLDEITDGFRATCPENYTTEAH